VRAGTIEIVFRFNTAGLFGFAFKSVIDIMG
jgi:hypothetical protein